MIENFQQLLAFQDLLRAAKIDRKAYAAPDYSKMRFKLGTSLAETKIPYALDPAFENILKHAAETLFLAIPMRHREDIGPMELDAVLLDPAAVNISLRPPLWYVGDIPAESVFYRIITRSMLQNRRLDTGLLLWWFGKDAPGRQLVTELNRFINKLDTEQKERGAGEETLRIGILALIRFWGRFRSSVSERAKHPVITEAYNAAAVVHYEVLRTLLEERYRPLGVTDRKIGDSAAAAYQALTLPLSPGIFARNEQSQGIDWVSPYGIGKDAMLLMERFFPGMLDRATPPAEVAKQIAQKIAADRAAPKVILGELRLQKLFQASIELLWRIKPGDDKSPEKPIIDAIRGFLKEPEKVLAAIDDKKQSKEWQDAWRRLFIDAYKPQMEAFQTTIMGLAKLSEGVFSDKAALQNAYNEYAQRYVTVKHVEALSSALIDQTSLLQQFTGSKDALQNEYAAGKLYRFGADDQPIIQAGGSSKEAQLFVDLKDFTKRTFASKEVAMADLMKWEFYDPILKAGKKYSLDMAHLDNNSLSINNLLGDAVLASGSVKTLIQFAYDIIQICEGYKGKLQAKMPAALVAAKLKELDEQFQKDRTALEVERNKYAAPMQKLTADYNALPPTDPKKAQVGTQLRAYQEAAGAAARMLKKVTVEYQDKRTTIEGSGLEAGAYVAYGNAAEMITFKDNTFGNLKVAIGEKINESARGTARDGIVRESLDYLLDRAKAVAKRTDLEYPFRVYIDNIVRPVMDPDIENQLRKALETKDPEAVKKAVTALSQRMMNDLVTNIKNPEPDFRSISTGNGIYNLGLAISGDAIDAYLKIVETRRQVVRQDLVPAQLHEEIKRKFFFPQEKYPMVIVPPEEPGQRVEVFVEMGNIVFKGFEKAEPQRIWECLLANTLFYKLLAKHHFEGWVGASI